MKLIEALPAWPDMQATRHEDRVETEICGPLHVSADAVTNGQDFAPGNFPPGEPSDGLLGKLVDRPVRLAGIDYLAAILLIEKRECTGAVDKAVASLDQMIWIGADHRELAADG